MAASKSPRIEALEDSENKKGVKPALPSLPEFKKVSQIAEVYSGFTQANLRHKILIKKEKDRLLLQQAVLASTNSRHLKDVNS